MQILKQSIKTIILSMLFLFLIGTAYAWTEPTSNPPSGNVSAPINTSSTAQTKQGVLNLSSTSTSDYLSIYGPLSGQYTASGLNLAATDSNNYWHLGYRGGLSGEQKNLSAWFYNGSSWISPLSLTSTGNVGIGTTGPDAKLHVIGSICAESSDGGCNPTSGYIRGSGLCIGSDCKTSWPSGTTGSGTTNYISKWTGASSLGNSLIYDNGTSVAIGRTDPTFKFEVYGDGARSKFTNTNTANTSNVMILQNNSTKGYSSIDFNNPSGGQMGFIGYGNSSASTYGDKIYLGSMNKNIIINPGTANVGIGTTDPGSYKLNVNGNVSVSDIYITSIGKWASELYVTYLVGNLHTTSQCSSNGGSAVSDGSGNQMCKFTSSSCPVGWTQYNNWSTTQNNSANYTNEIVSGSCIADADGNGPSQTCGTSTASCSVSGHSWSNISQESSSCSGTQETSKEIRAPLSICLSYSCSGATNITVTASRTEIGCY